MSSLNRNFLCLIFVSAKFIVVFQSFLFFILTFSISSINLLFNLTAKVKTAEEEIEKALAESSLQEPKKRGRKPG